ncbi:hypothetical protein J2I47_16625 [Fibrella sp. HMF5335]|uniref:Uncharacterized protein n=1 Tax=Fibrella rubiginis TaxID=2817060 RepID=A0A939GFS1_9BACT|nr:hypothetical protein [Fibrella rubiginis]MBO0938179.1 hypothetical protein [Fibrella rubiginis]
MNVHPTSTVQHALNQFYTDHDFGEEGGVNEQVVWLTFGPVAVPLPNTEQRKKVIWLHDLHHLLNEYPTTWSGEGRVSAWELATGGWGWQLYVWLLIILASSIGVLLFPRRAFLAFVRGTYCRPILSLGLTKTQLMQLPVSDLRHRLGIELTRPYPACLSHYLRFCLIWLFYVSSVIGFGVGLYVLIA